MARRLRPAAPGTCIVGAGGRQRYRVDAGDPRLAFSEDDVNGALRLRLQPGVARLSFVTTAGDVLDRTTVRCRSG